MTRLVSVVIRTYNEERYLEELLDGISKQRRPDFDIETVIVDSGSTDGTLRIAQRHQCRIVHIQKSDFTFGRSLNRGCAYARGDVLVFVSGHCVPATEQWIGSLVGPIFDGVCAYTYGRQIGRDTTKFSEAQVFDKYFPDTSRIPQSGAFCNNANAALAKSAWKSYPFDELLTGLEDLDVGKRIVQNGGKIGYVAEAAVYHIHNETWRQVKNRYERESLALQQIMPEIHVGSWDFIRYFISGVLHDFSVAIEQRKFWKVAGEIIRFRLMQFWGTYRGNREHRQLSIRKREDYFFPARPRSERRGATDRIAANEGSQ